MRSESCRIDGTSYGYGVVDASGPTVVLVHGWGLARHSYRRAAESLATAGYRVVVPDLPGFGTSSDLPLNRISLESYAASMQRFLEGCDELGGGPVHLVGHSFGGAVVAQLAHDAPDLASSVILVSSVSGATWVRHESESGGIERLLRDRPVWDWGVHLVHEFPMSRFPVAALDVLRDLSHNLVWHLPSLGIVASIIRKSDLRDELALVRERGIPAAVVWASDDRVITRAAFDDQCEALGCDGTVVEGNHGWPLSEPARFARTIAGILDEFAKR